MEFEAECLSGLKIDHELEFGGLHDWKIARLLALENSPGVNAKLVIGIGDTCSITHQAASRDKLALAVAPWQRMASRQLHDLSPIRENERTGTYKQCTST